MLILSRHIEIYCLKNEEEKKNLFEKKSHISIT